MKNKSNAKKAKPTKRKRESKKQVIIRNEYKMDHGKMLFDALEI